MSINIEQKGTIIYKNSRTLILLSKARAKYLPFDDKLMIQTFNYVPRICLQSVKSITRTFFFNLLIFFAYLLKR